MNDREQEILEEAIKIAMENDWSISGEKVDDYDFPGYKRIKISVNDWEGYYSYAPEELIFNHEFAKCLWPDDEDGNRYWKMHLQRMVAVEDRFEYLGKHI